MAIAPSISPCARNEGYKYQVLEENSRYLERELFRSSQAIIHANSQTRKLMTQLVYKFTSRNAISTTLIFIGQDLIILRGTMMKCLG